MYTIKEICSGASIVAQSVLGRKQEYKLRFNKEKDGCWYVDFPNWPFSHANLAIVSGADKMLELLLDGDLLVKVSVIPAKKKEQHEGYIELKQTEHSLFGGSTYQVKYESLKERFKRDTLWICPITPFVLGHYPKFIYVKKITENDCNVCAQPYFTNAESLDSASEDMANLKGNSCFVTHYKDRAIYIKLTNGNETSVIEVRDIDGEQIIYDNRYSIGHIPWLEYESEPIEISEEEFESVNSKQTDIEEYVSRKVEGNEIFYISITAEDGMEIFEFQGKNYKRSVGTVIDEGIVEGKFDDVNLDWVVSWAKRRGGASNILSSSDFEDWWKKRKYSWKIWHG